MALIDTWYSSSKLLSEGFNPSIFILNNKYRLKLEECFLLYWAKMEYVITVF